MEGLLATTESPPRLSGDATVAAAPPPHLGHSLSKSARYGLPHFGQSTGALIFEE